MLEGFIFIPLNSENKFQNLEIYSKTESLSSEWS